MSRGTRFIKKRDTSSDRQKPYWRALV
ncbi:uncharacterized protein METZ01_LOCUS490603, partial [marine metagenome]